MPVAPVLVTPSTVTCPVTLNVPDIVTPSELSVVLTTRMPVLPVASKLNAAAVLSTNVQILELAEIISPLFKYNA